MPSFRQRLCEILAFTSTLISVCTMQVHVQRSVAGCFAVLCQLCSIRRFVPSSVYQSLVVALVLSWLDYSNVTLAGRPLCSTISSPSSMPQLSRSLVSVARSTLQMLSPVSTGFERPSTSSSNWRSSYDELFTALHFCTYPANCGTSPIYRRDTEAGCARRPPVFLTSARRDLSLSAIAHCCCWPACGVSGTFYLLTSSLLYHSQHFVRN